MGKYTNVNKVKAMMQLIYSGHINVHDKAFLRMIENEVKKHGGEIHRRNESS